MLLRRPLIRVLLLLCGSAGCACADGIDLEAGREFWAFKRPVVQELPEVGDPGWASSPIDRLVRAKLDENGQAVPPELEKSKLLRRVYFDLHGLPPTPEQLDAALADESDGAFEVLVDQLLASPRFGERWGRHWLDVVRFADSTGGGRTMLLEHSWRYRDYVVDAFNRDKPYDEFLTEQLAGDLLTNTDVESEREHLIATTFLALGPSNYELQDKELLTMEIVDEQVDTVGRAFMAMTLGCARCHDHMFDPISARDYYALAGIFKSTKTVEHSNVSQWLLAELPAVTPEEQRAQEVLRGFEARLEEAKAGVAAAEAEIAELEIASVEGSILIDDTEAEIGGTWVSSTSNRKWVGAGYIHDNSGDGVPREVAFTPAIPAAGRYEVRVSYSAGGNRSTRTPVRVRHRGGESLVRIDQKQKPVIDGLFARVGTYEFDAGSAGSVLISNAGSDGVTIVDAVQWVPVDRDASPQQLAAEARRETLEGVLAARRKELEEITKSKPKAAQPMAMTVRDETEPGAIPISVRGDVHSPGELVPRGFPQVIEIAEPPAFSELGSGRLELARWLTAEDHPLTARVMVNRLWEKLMGEGLVRTLDNFGSTGERPSDPQLLDWLALRLIENGWSIKATLREILLTRSYRSVRPEPRRLEAEALRDAMLSASGQLDETMGGATIKPGTKSEFEYRFESDRRSLYLPVFRNALPDSFAVFDFPDPNLVAGKRHSSTLATQALYFMNHPFVIEQSEHAAQRLLQSGALSVGERIDRAYRIALGRRPSPAEAALADDFLGDSPTLSSWSAFYQSLFACVDFRFVE